MIDIHLGNMDGVMSALDRADIAIGARGGGGDAVRWMAEVARDYAARITHIDTGALSSSHVIDDSKLRSFGLARIYIGAVANPKSRVTTDVYGPFEHGRGGDHAFYDRTVQERGQFIESGGVERATRSLRDAWR